MPRKIAIIIGAGPAGLTAAFEFLTRSDIKPILLERSEFMGGLARTIVYKGNRMDLGGHRFFSKSDRVMDWWLAHLPLDKDDATKQPDMRMMVRSRRSRIYFLRQFFDYPIQPSAETLQRLGFWRTTKIAASYLRRAFVPIRPAGNLEEFFINRFGRELYLTFFKTYTEKVWGIPCNQISAEWGAQRVKGLSIRTAVSHFLKQRAHEPGTELVDKEMETSLIEKFLYPKLGPGQMWEEVARKVVALGGEIRTGMDVTGVEYNGERITDVVGTSANGGTQRFAGDYFLSTTSVQELIRALGDGVPPPVREVSEGLVYRDFITVGLLLKKLKLREADGRSDQMIRDNWIYIQEPDVLVGRLQIYNNWSRYLVADPANVMLGAEYFCNEGDALWSKSDSGITQLAMDELEKIEVIARADVLDANVARMRRTYPAYFGTYKRLGEVREYLAKFVNLFLVGRNGMHKYNNMDHSMLTAMTAVDNILAGRIDKSNIWAVNTEDEYHEGK
jgi:protoporphyrinogen oxidase